MQNLFMQTIEEMHASSEASLLTQAQIFLDRVQSSDFGSKFTCANIFVEAMKDLFPKLEWAAEREKIISLTKEEKALLSDDEIIKMLRLKNIYATSGNRSGVSSYEKNAVNARTRIIECFRKESTVLDLSSLDLVAIPKELLSLFPKLKVLNLSMNELTKIDLSDLRELTHLNLDYNRLFEIDLSHQKNLSHLSLKDASFYHLEKLDLSHLQKLKELNLSYLGKGFFGLGRARPLEVDLSGLTNLVVLDISNLDENVIINIDKKNYPNLKSLITDKSSDKVKVQ
jgi:Leucine-rich repeat (LRR) protein